MTPDSLTAATEKANMVTHISVARPDVKFCRSNLRRSPLLVLIAEVGSEGVFLRSKAIVNEFVRKLSLEMLGTLGKAFWNM